MKNKGQPIRIRDKERGTRMIGFLNHNRKTFKKEVYLSKHLFRKFDAYGIDAEYFTNVLLPNNYKIIVVEKEEKKVYNISVKGFKKHSMYFHFKENQNKDHRSQIFCPRRFWKKENSSLKKLTLKDLSSMGVFG